MVKTSTDITLPEPNDMQSGRPPLPQRITQRLHRLAQGLTSRSPIEDLQGSFLRAEDGTWEVWFRVSLIHAYEWLSADAQDGGYDRHVQLGAKLEGYTGHIEVLPVPVSAEERYRRFREFELDERNPLKNDPDWSARRHERVLEMTDWIQMHGDVESRGYLGITLRDDPDLTMTLDEFKLLDEENRFFVNDPALRNHVAQATLLRVTLQAAWGKTVSPVSPDELDVMLILTSWPGQEDTAVPKPVHGQVGSRSYVSKFYGRVDYEQAAPGVLKFDRHGSSSFASFLPMTLPTFGEFIPGESEFAFQGNTSGRRVRFSFRFKVWSGKEMLNRARKTRSRNFFQQRHLAENEGVPADMAEPLTIADAFYMHAFKQNPTMVGIPMLIVTGSSVKEVQNETRMLETNLGTTATLALEPKYQMMLYAHSRPGSRQLVNGFQQYLTLKAFARGMPFVSASAATTGPDHLGWVRGKELTPHTGGFDLTSLRPDLNIAPVTLKFGPSGGGKTTEVVNGSIALLERTGAVGFIFELLKDDVSRLLGESLPNLELRRVNLLDHPGLLNPALLAARPSEQVGMMTEFLKNCVGEAWENDWQADLNEACEDALYDSESHGRPLPSLFAAIELLKGMPSARHLYAQLQPITQFGKASALFLSDNYDKGLFQSLSQPGLNLVGQDGLRFPETDDAKNYSAENRLALAGMNLVSLLGRKVSVNRNVRVLSVTVEFHETSRLSKGRTEAEHQGRVGRSYMNTVVLDTQFPDDVDKSLFKHVTTRHAFTVTRRTDAVQSLQALEMDPSDPVLIYRFMNMARDPAGSNRNKGVSFILLPTGETLLVQSDMYYLPRGRTTESQLPSEERAAQSTVEVRT